MRRLTSGALLDAVRGVHWPGRQLSAGALAGTHRSRRVGSSPEFLEYRAYRQGDDPSRIDWKLFGRTERVAIRLTHDDSSLRTFLLVDASASMAFPAATGGKWELAAALALGLVAVAHGDGDPVGLAIAGGGAPRLLPPRTHRGIVGDALRLLVDTAPGGSAPLAPVLAALRARRIAVVSDFLGDGDALLAAAAEQAAAGAELHAVHVVAEEELDPSGLAGPVTDPEEPALRRELGREQVAAYQAAFGAWRGRLADAWRGVGAQFTTASTGEPADRIVRRITAPPSLAA